MSVTYELLEEFTGTRSNESPDPDNENETITIESTVKDVKVRFTCDRRDIVHERFVNVCYDAVGAYDAEATLVRIGEVLGGVEHKMLVGVISS